MITRRHFLKMIGYGSAAVAIVKLGGVPAAKSLLKKPEFKGSFSGGPMFGSGGDGFNPAMKKLSDDVDADLMDTYGLKIGYKFTISGVTTSQITIS